MRAHWWPYIALLALLTLLLQASAARAAPPPAARGAVVRPGPAPLALQAGPSTEARAQLLQGGGAYADTFAVLRREVRDFERDPQNRYTHCIRSTAVYECLSYGSDGQVRRQRVRTLAHGTGFAYRVEAGETLLLTNQHVADWPPVTDSAHRVDDVPLGCKRISDTLKIVENEQDDYGADDIPLSRVVQDEALDMAVVKAKASLRVLPYRIGRSAALRTGDVVMVRGFPLGAFLAVNTGKVINPHDRDDYRDWDHVDFIIDAPLSQGNSGSPVLAVSQRSGEYELVGVFHTGYTRATALNAVIGIDQIRDLMVTLKRAPRGAASDEASGGGGGPAEVLAALQRPEFVPLLPLGPLTVGLRSAAKGEVLLYEVYSKKFPLDDRRVMVLAERAPGGKPGAAPGELSGLWLGNERGLKSAPLDSLDGETRAEVLQLWRRLQRLVGLLQRYRSLGEQQAREAAAERAHMSRSLTREAAADNELAQGALELADRLGPRGTDRALSLAALLTELGK